MLDSKLNPFVASSRSFPGSFLVLPYPPEAVAWHNLQQIQTLPRLGFADGYGIADVQVHALRGDKQKALSALRQAIEQGWRTLWWYFLKHDPNLEPLHDEPEYQAMVAEIEADMAEQLARVREMERNGELEPIPQISATIQ